MQSLEDILSPNGQLYEQHCTSAHLKRMKRGAEHESWVAMNEAATTIQKVYKGRLVKEYLINLLEQKYFNDMSEPSIKL